MVEQQRVDVIIQSPDCLLSPQTEAGCHGYDGGRRVVRLQPLNCLKILTVNDQHTRTVGEPQLINTQTWQREPSQQLIKHDFIIDAFLTNYLLTWEPLPTRVMLLTG